MNSIKTGKLISALRTSKGMTQKQLADKINISDKAVSKWERGDGCPDVSILPVLAQALGVEVDNILSGELPPSSDCFAVNPTKKIKLYDFRRPDHWGAEDLRAIYNFFVPVTQEIEALFASIRNEKCSVSVSSIDQLTNLEFTRSIPSKCFLFDYDFNNSGFFIEMDPAVGKSLLKQSPEVFPEVTKFDVDVMQNFFIKNVVEIFNRKLFEKLPGTNDELKAALTKQCTETKIITSTVIQPQQQMCCLVSLELHVGNEGGMINLQFSDPFMRLLQNAGFFGFNWKQPEVQYLSSIKSKKLENNLFVELGRFCSDLVQLEPGKIYIFDRKYYDPLDLVYKNQVIHRGEVVLVDENFAIRINDDGKKPDVTYTEENYISVVLGACYHTDDVIKNIIDGTVIELNTYAGYPSPVIKNGKLVAYGEIIVSDDNFGVRIIEVVE